MFTITSNDHVVYQNENMDEATGVLRAYLVVLKDEGWAQTDCTEGVGFVTYTLWSAERDTERNVTITRSGR